MALALGLGSMFNHSNKPNVGFQRDFDNKVIRYTTLREIQPNEELCISYGSNLWFPDMEQQPNGPDQVNDPTGQTEISSSEDETENAFLSKLQLSDDEDLDP
jgi:SET domain-containing protein